MPTTRLQDDLLHEFREEKRMIQAQIDDFNPLALSLRKPAAQRLASKGLILFGELLCWALFLAAIATCVFLHRLYPFYELFSMRLVKLIDPQDIQALQWSIYVLIGLSGLLFVLIARSLARIRQKNDILNMAGSRIKTLVGQHLQRKAAIDAIEQRHFNELPVHTKVDANDVPNPAYDPNEGIVHKPLP